MNFDVVFVAILIVLYFGGLAVVMWEGRKELFESGTGDKASGSTANKPPKLKP